jgi:hypothetical protein
MKLREVTHVSLPYEKECGDRENQWLDEKGNRESVQSLATARRLYRCWLEYTLAGNPQELTLWRRGKINSASTNDWRIIAIVSSERIILGSLQPSNKAEKLAKKILEFIERGV